MNLTENTRQLLQMIDQTPEREWDLTWNALQKEAKNDGIPIESVVLELLEQLAEIEKRGR
jgi:predicted O-methyltransferase YrrM